MKEEYHCYQLHTTFLNSILVLRLTAYVDDISGDRQWGFQRNISTNDQIFRISHIL
jgi:hypothetical protein